MKLLSRELSGEALNWAVATAQGKSISIEQCNGRFGIPGYGCIRSDGFPFAYESRIDSIKIMESENYGVTPVPCRTEDIRWQARERSDPTLSLSEPFFGKTPVEAILRLYVTKKLGDEIDVPGKLSNGDDLKRKGIKP